MRLRAYAEGCTASVIVIERPFVVGDVITEGDVRGTVERALTV